MSDPGRPRAAVIFNPVKTNERALRAAVAQEETAAGWAPTLWFKTSIEDPGTDVAREALEAGASVVIVAGGDGTVRAVAETMRGSGVPLALAPAGTGNLLARNLRLTLNNLPHAVHTAFTGDDRMIDIALAELRREDGAVSKAAFLVMAGIGLDARMATATSPELKRRVGWLAYADPIARSVLTNTRFPMDYRLGDSRRRSAQVHTVIVGNCGTLTANVLLLPDAVVDDGLLDVIVMRPRRLAGWARIGSRLAFNRFLHRTKTGRIILAGAPKHEALQYAQSETMTARFESPQEVELDGDSFGPVTALRLTVDHLGLTIKVPAT
ncbi:diacylglycerol/lipid kinase family protein [Leifsonia poae]|uniref:Sphingosine kinase n=1 Tax=Leifsonia poae TaxID=110933 RepID=A0A9W6HBJ9_9MICO|nr:diacylglycerol kinase family protein [Leifsonia poae]GLJ77095.1 sphingosine kinase [Leifsonia poae]